jgi:hypothetical protein
MSKSVVMAGWDDVPHLTEDAKAELLAATPPHLIDSRSKGVPGMGSGAVYPVPEKEIMTDIREIPPWFRRAYGMDVGWNYTAVLFGAFDMDLDILYVYDGFKRQKAEPEIHAAAIKKRYPGGVVLPGCIDPAARNRSQVDGRNLMRIYRKDEGLKLVPADNAVTAGIDAVWSRLSTGRLKVARHLTDFFDEYRLYRRREDGKIVKEHDHYMDALRYLVMTGPNIAKPVTIKQIKGVSPRRYF